ncbi:MAG: hypothetical protein GY930_10980 [bacterium]|nr:hypothetical protein [bacterium]
MPPTTPPSAPSTTPGGGPNLATSARCQQSPDLDLTCDSRDRLLSFIRRNMGPKLNALCDAEDILQDTLLSAHQSPGGFKHRRDIADGGVLQWLHTVAMHRIWNLSRSMRPRVRPRTHTGLPPSHVEFPGEALETMAPPCNKDGPLNKLIRPELQEQALRAIRELDGDRRLSLVLRSLLGTSWPTVTFITGRKRESARKLHQRCTQSLRDQFLP